MKHYKSWPPKPYMLSLKDPYRKYYNRDTKIDKQAKIKELSKKVWLPWFSRETYWKFYHIGQRHLSKLRRLWR